MEVKKAFPFIEGLSVTFNPWLAIIAGATVYITKRENRYYSKRGTSVIFVIGAISGILCGFIGFGKEYLQWWNPYSEGILRSLIGIKLWIPGVMIGLAVWGILRGSKDENGKSD